MIWMPFMYLVVLDSRPGCRMIRRRIGMYIHSPIIPGASPWAIVNENCVLVPPESSAAPSPGSEGSTDGDSTAETDRTADVETGPRAREYDDRIVIWDVIEAGCYRQNLNGVRRCHDTHVLTVAQIPVAVRLLSQLLHGVHDLVTLCENCVSKRLRPTHILRHVVQHAWKREQRHHARIEG